MPEPARPDKPALPQPPIHDTASSADDHTGGLRPADDDLAFLEQPHGPGEMGRLGSFRILKELGRGGMGCVLLAEDTQLERLVALKIMLPCFAKDDTARTRFLREAKAAAKIHHDHVVTIHQVGEGNGVPFIAMEYLQGSSLERYLREKGALPLGQVLRIGREIALGLAEAHKIRLIHRDIKPANVWLEAPKGRVKILDFGLVRQEQAEESHLTQSGAILGTPGYMAPEQAQGQAIDARADLFSLGVLLYRLATGQPPFTGPTMAAVLLQVATHEPPPASAVKAGVPLEMSRIIGKLLAKAPAARYGSATAFLADWEQLMRATMKPGEPTLAVALPQADAPARVSGWSRRWWVLCGLLTALSVAGVVAWLAVGRRSPAPHSATAARNDIPPPVVARPPVEPPPLDAANAAAVQRLWAAKLKLPVETTNKLGMKLLLIPPGPIVDHAYYLGKYEVTQAEWAKVMGHNPSTFKHGNALVLGIDTQNFPVEQVSWFDSIEFCNKLSKREGLKPYYELKGVKRSKDGKAIDEAEVKILGGTGYHIPTDAEWEHACRAGTKTKYSFGDRDEDLPAYAWFDKNSGGRTHGVGELKPNGFGLYDMHGNVREWNEEMLTNATTGAPERVPRGGSWNSAAGHCAVSFRARTTPAPRNTNIGLRVARVP